MGPVIRITLAVALMAALVILGVVVAVHFHRLDMLLVVAVASEPVVARRVQQRHLSLVEMEVCLVAVVAHQGPMSQLLVETVETVVAVVGQPMLEPQAVSVALAVLATLG